MDKFLKLLTILLLVPLTANAITLRDCVNMAVEKHPNIKQYKYTANSIDGDIGIAKSAYYPDVYARGATGYEGYQYNGGDSKNGLTTEAEVGFNYKIFDGYDRRYRKKTAEYRKLSADSKLNESINSFTLQIVSSYLEVSKQRELVTVSEDILKRHKEFYDKVKYKFDKGLGRLSELKKAEALYTTSKLSNSVHKIDLDQALVSLEYYIGSGKDMDSISRPGFESIMPLSFEEALINALDKHPSIDVSKKNIEVAKAEMKKDMKSKYPEVNVKGSYGYDDTYTNTKGRNEYSVMFEVNYDIFDGHERDSLKRKRSALLLEKFAKLEKTKLDIELRLKLAWQLYSMIYEKIDYQTQAYSIEKTTLETYHKEFQLGLSDLMDISSAENDYIAAVKSLIASQYDLVYTKFRILEAMGIVYSEVMKNTSSGDGRYKDDIVNWKMVYGSLKNIDEETLRAAAKPEKIMKCYTVNASALNIRKSPKIRSKKMGKYRRGTVVCGDEIKNDWLKTSSGWLALEFLKPKK